MEHKVGSTPHTGCGGVQSQEKRKTVDAKFAKFKELGSLSVCGTVYLELELKPLGFKNIWSHGPVSQQTPNEESEEWEGRTQLVPKRKQPAMTG